MMIYLFVPIFIYFKGLGPTVSPLKENLTIASCDPVAKKQFTMMVEEVATKINELKSKKSYDTVVLCGIETHVCILATCIDLIRHGFNVSLSIQIEC